MGTKTIVQQVFDTPKGVLIYTPKTQPNYLQTKVIELHWQGFTASDISFLTNANVDFVDHTIAEYGHAN